jgi:hypothetical protein
VASSRWPSAGHAAEVEPDGQHTGRVGSAFSGQLKLLVAEVGDELERAAKGGDEPTQHVLDCLVHQLVARRAGLVQMVEDDSTSADSRISHSLSSPPDGAMRLSRSARAPYR